MAPVTLSRKLTAVFAAAALTAGVGVGVAAGAKKPHPSRILLKAAAQYLQVDRAGSTLSTGERQRLELMSRLHARDRRRSGVGERPFPCSYRSKPWRHPLRRRHQRLHRPPIAESGTSIWWSAKEARKLVA